MLRERPDSPDSRPLKRCDQCVIVALAVAMFVVPVLAVALMGGAS